MDIPTTIHESNVLDGIADAVAIIRSRNAKDDDPDRERTILFDTGQFNPPLIYPDPETRRLRKFRSGRLDYDFDIRIRIVFNLPFLTAAEAAKWRQLWNDYLAGYQIFMRPHNDNGLQLEWEVCPTPGTTALLRYVADRYIGHTTELSFTSLYTERSLNIKSSATRFRPTIYHQS